MLFNFTVPNYESFYKDWSVVNPLQLYFHGSVKAMYPTEQQFTEDCLKELRNYNGKLFSCPPQK